MFQTVWWVGLGSGFVAVGLAMFIVLWLAWIVQEWRL